MKVFSANPMGLLISISDWIHSAILDNIGMVISMLGCILGWLLYRSFNQTQDHLSRVARDAGDLSQIRFGARDDEPRSCIEGDNLHREGMRDDPLLDPKHKIFLSHSGAQKEFVEHLCVGLENRMHYPFFDRRHESLPKGERFPELIVRAAEQCEMLIVVLSDEYFMSKWPMIELNAFVKAHRLGHKRESYTVGPKILPLFYGLSVHDLKDASKHKKWFRKWETLVKDHPEKQTVLHDWKYALKVLGSFNGIPYDSNLKEIVAYEEKIVSCVCKSIAPNKKWDDSHVQGKLSILEVIGKKIEGIGVSRKYNVKVVGIFGVGGAGKTTTCKTMCNGLSSKYEGRVCHVEFSSVPPRDCKEFFQQALRDLTRKSVEDIEHLDEGECKNLLRGSLFRQKTFLAIDNISDHNRSLRQAKMFLEVPYHVDSLVVVTARSRKIFELLGIDEDACFEMPDLGEKDAVDLFLHYAASSKQFFEDEEMHDVMACVRRCYFSKGNGEGYHYHPLALQALGLQLGCYGGSPCTWVKNLPLAWSFATFSRENPVFDILRSSFDMLLLRDQTLFMDLGCFSTLDFEPSHLNVEWLCIVHKQGEEELSRRLQLLKQKGLLQDVDLTARRFSMHDLYLEFARLEANGYFNQSTNLKERMWVSIEEIESPPKDGCCHNLVRLRVAPNSSTPKQHGQIVAGMRWDYFSHVEALRLSGLHWKHGAFNCEGLLRLRVLELDGRMKIDRVEGLEKLNHLTYLQWICSELQLRSVVGPHLVGQLPSSLEVLRILVCGLMVGPDLLTRCHNLSKLELKLVQARSLDLSNCKSLGTVHVEEVQKLQTLSGLAVSRPPHLKSFDVHACEDLVAIPGIDRVVSLEKLRIESCPRCEVPNLLALTALQDLCLSSGQDEPGVHATDFLPHQLRELRCGFSQFREWPRLPGFNQLEALSFRGSHGLVSLSELGDLPALRRLDLTRCWQLLRLPDLSASKNLAEILLHECSSLELHGGDIQMLSELPLLQPVPFSGDYYGRRFRLDFARRKVLVHSSDVPPSSWELWKADGWEDQDLGEPPIRIGRRGSWEEPRRAVGTTRSRRIRTGLRD